MLLPRLVGPPGFVDQVGHKLGGHRWDLVDRYEADLVFQATELHPGGRTTGARFRLKRAFAREELGQGEAEEGLVARVGELEVRAVLLEHHGPCLGFPWERGFGA